MSPSNPNINSSLPGLLLILMLFTGVSAGCAPGGDLPPAATPTISAVYQIDPAIREYFETYGGTAIFGEAISQMVEQGGSKFQFTAAALWVFDPQAPASQFVRLAPLGASIIQPDRQDPPLPPPDPETPDPYYDNGQYVYQPFRPLYDLVGGQKNVGRPLTGVRYDALTERYEQYFEKSWFLYRG